MAGLLADDEEPKTQKGLLDRAKDTMTYGILNDLWRGATLPGDVWYGKVDPLSDEAIERTVNGLADLAPLSALGKFDPNTLYMFLGPKAKTANKAALKAAREMDEAGETARKIWDDTGWFKGADGKWRFEIDDSRAAYDPDALKELREIAASEGRAFDRHKDTTILGGVLDHKGLYQAYPEAEDTKVHFFPRDIMGDSFGSHSEARNAIVMRDDLTGKNATSALLHEGQHGVQSIEGFARGGNPREIAALQAARDAASKDLTKLHESSGFNRAFRKWLDNNGGMEGTTRRQREEFRDAFYAKQPEPVWNTYADAITRETEAVDAFDRLGMTHDPYGKPFDLYNSLAGEVEARNVQKRMNMSPAERRATPPWETMDVPLSEQIVREASPDDIELFMQQWLAGQGA